MKTKISPLPVNEESPFQGDALMREAACNNLLSFIRKADTPYVLAVDAPWGAGKTKFMEMLRAVCHKQNIPTVFFNAWKADFHDDALAAMVGEMSEEFKPKGEKAATVLEASKALVSREMMMAALKIIVEAIVGGTLAKGVNALAENMDKALQKFDVAEEYRKRREALKKFQEALASYAAQNGGRLVFFVDELDRCRPVFAIEVLEKIKHIFDVQGVFFVVAVNKEQLGKTTKSVYGEIDSDAYLRKFFDRSYPLVNRGGIIASAMERAGIREHLDNRKREASEDTNKEALDVRHIAGFLQTFCDIYGLSLRDCEQATGIVATTLLSIPPEDDFFPGATAFFAVMSIADPDGFHKFLLAVSREGNESVFSRFPFAELAERYEKATGIDLLTEDPVGFEEEHWVRYPYFWCCANRYHLDNKYQRMVDTEAKKDEGYAWKNIQGFAKLSPNRHKIWMGRGCLPNPKTEIERIATIGANYSQDVG